MSTSSETTLPLPVTAVTCTEDRAHVERAAVLELRAGTQRLRLGPVSALAVDRTLHAELTAGHPAAVLDVRIVREWRPRGPRPGDDDSALRRRATALEEERTALEQRRDRLHVRRDLLGRLAADLLREIGEGAGFGEAESDRWTRELDRVDAERDTHAERLRAVEAALAAVTAELSETRRALELSETEPAELVGHIDLTVRAEADGPAELRLSHLTPCALWRPAYRATLDGDSLTLDTEAVVWQRTGEDWTNVRLTLSTARSARATEPPRLGEDRLTLQDRSPAERRAVHVDLREEETADLGPLPALGLPGVDDGGEVRVLHSPAPVSVPADGRAHRVPLSSFTASARSEYACSPELSPLVAQVVRFDNRSGHALLAGPVDLFVAAGSPGAAHWTSPLRAPRSSWPSAAGTTTGSCGTPRRPARPPDSPSGPSSPAPCGCICPGSPRRASTTTGRSSCGSASRCPRCRRWRCACAGRPAPPRPTPSTRTASCAGTSRWPPAAGPRSPSSTRSRRPPRSPEC
ncbi:LOW QUALITY PROTEIN: conserved hypothetical protein, partial [Streptomyces griseoflavus Tu4000]